MKKKEVLKKIIFPVLIAAGGFLIFFTGVLSKKVPKQSEIKEKAYYVKTFTLKNTDIRPAVKGQGIAVPEAVFRAKAEVSGKIIWKNDSLEKGNIIKAGTELVKIDPVDYQLIISREKQEIKNASIQIQELKIEKSNLESILEIEKKSLQLRRKDFERHKALFEKNAVSEAVLDEKETAMLLKQTAVRELKNSLLLIPERIKMQETRKKLSEIKLTQAQRDLEDTVIKAPFDCRISNVEVEESQFVQAGELLFTADDIEETEVIAQFSPANLKPLMNGQNMKIFNFKTFLDIEQTKIKVDIENLHCEWDAEFKRISETMDSETQTVGIAVSVKKPYEKIIPGRRPALINGMYAEVELIGKLLKDRILIPRSAVHEGKVYLLDKNSRLKIKKFETAFTQGRFSVVKDGLKTGDTIVLSDIPYAVEGMLLKTEKVENILDGIKASEVLND